MQRRLYSRGVIDVGYVGSRGDHLLRYVDINQPQPTDFAGHAAQPNLVRPFPGYDAIVMRETTARSRYHGLVASFRHDAGRAGSATVNYTFSRNKADATYDNCRDRQSPESRWTRTPSLPQPAQTEPTSSPPPTSTSCRSLAAATGGWRKARIGRVADRRDHQDRVRSGRSSAGDELQLRRLVFPGARCGRIRSATRRPATRPACSGSTPRRSYPSPAGEYGTAPVAPFRLPGRHQWDIALSKNLSLGGTTRLQFRADLINAFNQTQFLDVNTVCSGDDDVRPPRPAFGQVTSTRPPREIQLGVRFDW